MTSKSMIPDQATLKAERKNTSRIKNVRKDNVRVDSSWDKKVISERKFIEFRKSFNDFISTNESEVIIELTGRKFHGPS